MVVDEFTKFKDNKESRLSSQPCIVRNLPWKILAMSKPANNRDYTLGFFLQCNAESESTRWSVCAVAELKLLHLTDPSKNFVKSRHLPSFHFISFQILIIFPFFSRNSTLILPQRKRLGFLAVHYNERNIRPGKRLLQCPNRFNHLRSVVEC